MSLFGQMKGRLVVLVLLMVVIGLGMGYVRFAPSDPGVWHRPAYPSGVVESQSSSGYLWREGITEDGLSVLGKLDAIIMATPRTTRLAGSVDEGLITYVTRSAFFGFPDYTTVGITADGDLRYLEINGRARFGLSDLGVNADRIKGWLGRF